MSAINIDTNSIIANMRQKRAQRAHPSFRVDRATVLSWSRQWLPDYQLSSPLSDDYRKVTEYSEEQTPRLRLCVPMSDEEWGRKVRPALLAQSITYTRVPIQADNAAWYFFDELSDLRAALAALQPTQHPRSMDAVDRWQQRIRVSFEQERYHLHLQDFLQEKRVRFVRVACEAERQSWFFLNQASEVVTLLQGLDMPTPMPA